MQKYRDLSFINQRIIMKYLIYEIYRAEKNNKTCSIKDKNYETLKELLFFF